MNMDTPEDYIKKLKKKKNKKISEKMSKLMQITR